MRTTPNSVEVQLDADNVSGHRRQCACCGGEVSKLEVPAVFDAVLDGPSLLCVGCLRAGADAIPQRLTLHAEAIEQRAIQAIRDAARLREAAGREWLLPTVDAWEAAERTADEALAR